MRVKYGFLSRASAALAIAIFSAAGCVQQERNRQEMLHQEMVTLNRSQIMVMTGDLPEPHKLLGEIKYTEPFSAEAFETEHINEKLRHLAIDRYQDNVDAITHLTTTSSPDGKDFIVSGDAVEVVGPCTFCRHKEVVIVNRPNSEQREVSAPSYQVGDTWVARLNGTDGKVEVLKLAGGKVVMDWFGHRNTYTRDGNLISGHVGTLVGSFDPDLGTLNFPLWAGKTWSKDWLLKMEQGQIWGNTHGKAIDWEQVNVPAGTLEALKLSIVYRTGLSHMEMTCWYAPEVNALAKCDSTDADFKSEELTAYRPASANLIH